MGVADYLTGRRVYNGAGNAPTRGTVDPMGYVERELNNPSQKRSGLAQAALSRLAPGQSAWGSGPADASNPAYRQHQAKNSMPGGPPAVRTPTGHPSMAPAPMPQPLTVSPIGKIGASQGATSLPFDLQASDDQESLMAQKSAFDGELSGARQQLEREYMEYRRAAENQMPDLRRQLLEGNAGRGMAYSSGYAYDQGMQEKQFADLLAQLQGDRTAGLDDLLRQQGAFGDQYNAQLNTIQRAAARRLAEQAGDLGLGEPAGIDAVGDDLLGGGAPALEQAAAPVQQAPIQQAPVQAPQVNRHIRDMTTFDPQSQAVLAQGGTIRGGNGLTYKYDPITQKAVPV